MAIPKIKEAILTNPNTVMLYFDNPLDNRVAVPVVSFTINYGQFGVETVNYASDAIVSLGLDSDLSPWDEVFVSYEPPIDFSLCMRGPVPSNADDVIKKRNAVRSFHRYSVSNSLASNERTDGTRKNTNLGETIGGYGFPYQNRNSNPKNATVGDFVTIYGLKEAIQLTNIDDASATSVNTAKLQMAIEDANALIDSYIEQSGKSGRVLITSNRRRTALIIARYYLDTIRRREDVYKDYVECLKQLDAERQMTAIRAGHGDSAIDTKRGIMRSWRIPQRYNSVSGKGFSGWNPDTGGDQSPDFRIGFGATGQNAQAPNWLSPRDYEDLGGTLLITEPDDAGGLYTNGSDVSFP
jgi:phage gp36-like protein